MNEKTFATTLRADLEALNTAGEDALPAMLAEIEGALESMRAEMQHWADMLLMPETA